MIHDDYLRPRISTRQAAKQADIGLSTLRRWMAQKRFEAPKLQLHGNVLCRRWNEIDVAHLRQCKKRSYCKGRVRKSVDKRRTRMKGRFGKVTYPFIVLGTPCDRAHWQTSKERAKYYPVLTRAGRDGFDVQLMPARTAS